MKSKKTTETFTFMGNDYPLQEAMDSVSGHSRQPVMIQDNDGSYTCVTTVWLDNVCKFDDDIATGSNHRAAVRALERKCIRQFKAMAKVCGYDVSD